jgi:hypothetical protein
MNLKNLFTITRNVLDIDSAVLSVQTSLTEREKKALERVSQDEYLISVLNKLEYGLALTALKAQSVTDIAELRGGQRMLKVFSDQLLSSRPKKAVNHLTGE